MSRILLDTNIIIHREAVRLVNRDIGVLFYWIDKLHHTKCIHPLTVTEINRYADDQAVNTMQIKLDNYELLKTEAPMHPAVKKVCEDIDCTPNDAGDTKLINEVYCGRVDILISEDKKIHSKAALLDISERVFRIDSFLEKIVSENPDLVNYNVLSINKEFIGNINLQDPFFDSFRTDYDGFDRWFNAKANELAYVCMDNGMLSAFLYLKKEDENENYHNVTPILPPKRRLKVGTFKVTSNGIKLGERFLKIVFDNARQFSVSEIYVTIFDRRPEQLRLISLLEEYGFKYHGVKSTPSGEEKVYVRDFGKNANLKQPKLSFPWLGKEANIYIVPIKPEYHTELFPDSILRTESPLDFIENQPHRNAISKVYISHSKTRELKSGDIIVFYRSGGIYKGVATTIGIVENIVPDISTFEELIRLCRKRTVLKDEELRQYWERNPGNRPFVINFLYAFSFKKRANLKTMLDEKILANMESVKTITKMDLNSLVNLIKISGI